LLFAIAAAYQRSTDPLQGAGNGYPARPMPSSGSSVRASLSRLPRVYWILWTGALINRLGGFVLPLLALYLTGPRGLSVAQTGVVISLLGAGMLCSGPLGGFLADKLGRKRTLIFALVAGSVAMLHLSAARLPWHIGIGAFLLGLFGDLYRPAVSAAIADLVEESDRVFAYGTLYWAVNLGFAVGSSLGGFLATRGWLLLFYGDALTTLAFAVIVWWKVPETRPVSTRHERVSILTPLADGRFVLFVVLTGMVWMIFHQGFVTLPIDLNAHGLSPRVYGALIAENGVLIVLLQPIVGRATARFARHRVLAFSAVLVGCGFGLTGFVHGLVGYGLSIAVWSLGEIVMAGLGPAVAADAAPAHLRGAYQGLFQAGGGTATLLAPILGSFALERFGSRTLWSCCALLGFCGAAGHFLLGSIRNAASNELQ
jgi:MFS family permease